MRHATDPSIFEQIAQRSSDGQLSAQILDELEVKPGNLTPARGTLTKQEQIAFTEVFNEAKLRPLLGQIGMAFGDGQFWPRPLPGFIDLWGSLQSSQLSGRQLDTAVISAGHTGFINRTFDMWQTAPPDILVSSDTIHQKGLDLIHSPKELAKPEPLIMQVTLGEWALKYGIGNLPNGLDELRQRTLFVGDDITKDGGLAINSGVDFIHINPDNQAEAWQAVAAKLGLGKTVLARG